MHIINKILLYLFFTVFIPYSFSTNLELDPISNLLCLSDLADKDTVITEQVRNSLIKLSPETPFVIFDLNLTQEDLDNLKKVKINSNSQGDYNNYDELDNLQNGINDYLQSLGNSFEIANTASKLITKIIFQSLIGCKRETAWVTLRTFSQTDAYDIPRWHSDGNFYTSNSEQYKIAMALKGPQTLFYPKALFQNLSPEMQNEFHSLSVGENSFSKKNRIAQTKMLDMFQVISANLNQAALFLVGDNGALHSEPPIHEERLFLSILPASKEEINELYRNWHPRESQ